MAWAPSTHYGSLCRGRYSHKHQVQAFKIDATDGKVAAAFGVHDLRHSQLGCQAQVET